MAWVGTAYYIEPWPISLLIVPSRDRPPMSLGNVNFRALYIDGWTKRGILPKQNCFIFIYFFTFSSSKKKVVILDGVGERYSDWKKNTLWLHAMVYFLTEEKDWAEKARRADGCCCVLLDFRAVFFFSKLSRTFSLLSFRCSWHLELVAGVELCVALLVGASVDWGPTARGFSLSCQRPAIFLLHDYTSGWESLFRKWELRIGPQLGSSPQRSQSLACPSQRRRK